MEMTKQILQKHPAGMQSDVQQVAKLIGTIADCESTCVVCADACLSEDDVKMLAQCISLNYDCADACSATWKMLARVGHRTPQTTSSQLQACRDACRACAEECERHEHEHCRVCAQACRQCEQACNQALESQLAMV